MTIDNQRSGRTVRGAIAGILSGGLALAVGQLVAGLISSDSSPVVAVGQLSIDLTPPPVKDFAISAFGSHDKVVLVGGILVVLAIFAAVVGVLAMRRLAYGMTGLAIFALVGLIAALTRPGASAGDALPTLVGGAAAVLALRRLVRAAPPPVSAWAHARAAGPARASGPSGAGGPAGSTGSGGQAASGGAPGANGSGGSSGPAGSEGPAGRSGAGGPAGPSGAGGPAGPGGRRPAGPGGPSGPAGPGGAARRARRRRPTGPGGRAPASGPPATRAAVLTPGASLPALPRRAGRSSLPAPSSRARRSSPALAGGCWASGPASASRSGRCGSRPRSGPPRRSRPG